MSNPVSTITGRPLVATLSKGAIRHNARRTKQLAGASSQVLGVVKADAYGHGLLESVAALDGLLDGWAVLELMAARRLRANGVDAPILMLEGYHSTHELAEFATFRLSTVVHLAGQLDMLAQASLPLPIPVFLKLNTGMNRLGFPLIEAQAVYERLQSMPQVASVTVMTHFADADNARGFAWQLQRLSQAWPEAMKLPTSFANSAALISAVADHQAIGDVVRPGIMLYGASPWGCCTPGKTAEDLQLQPVMTLQSSLIGIQDIQPGERVGYGGVYTVDKPMRIGVVACGYADGYPRHATNTTPILVDGVRTTLTGRVSMDRLCCDITDIPSAQIGSPVTLWGQGLPVDEVAESAGTIAYELLCAVSPRVPKVWVD